jgi:hypothetical protein
VRQPQPPLSPPPPPLPAASLSVAPESLVAPPESDPPVPESDVVVPPESVSTGPESEPGPGPESGAGVTHWLLTQDWPLPQPPQSSVFPQPSGNEPQVALFAAHVVGVQPHFFGSPPPPQVSGDAQAPQVTFPPQPSGAVPQF